jgi:hypothetical protein
MFVARQMGNYAEDLVMEASQVLMPNLCIYIKRQFYFSFCIMKKQTNMSVENMVKQDNPMSSNQFTVMFLSTNSWYTKQKMHARTTYNADT